jgi:hypothetical protein
MLLAFLQEVEYVSTQCVRIISPIPIDFPVGTCQRIIVLGTPSAYCRVCLGQLLIQPPMHHGCYGASRDCCTHHTSHTLEGHDDLHAHLDRDPFVGEQQRFAWFVPVEDDVMTRMSDVSVLENVPDLRQQRHDPVADIMDVRPTTHGSKGVLGHVLYLDVVGHGNFLPYWLLSDIRMSHPPRIPSLAACRRELFDRRLRCIVPLAHEQKMQNRR